jgi:hypothetical protein
MQFQLNKLENNKYFHSSKGHFPVIRFVPVLHLKGHIMEGEGKSIQKVEVNSIEFF